MQKLRALLFKEVFGIAAAVGTVVLALAERRLPSFAPYDFEFLLVMTGLLMAVDSLERKGITLLPSSMGGTLAGWLRAVVPLVVTFAASAVLTNDGALVMLLPAAMRWYGRERAHVWIAAMALAANGGAMLTPAGAPQNLLIAWRFGVPYPSFVAVTALPALVVLGVVIVVSCLVRGHTEESDATKGVGAGMVPELVSLALLFGVMLRLLPFWAALLPVLWFVATDTRSLFRVDWPLLGTFLAFFAFTDLLVSGWGRALASLGRSPLWPTVGLSFAVGNVPATLLLIDVTKDWKGLLLGSAIGAYGPVWASMVGIIAYRFGVHNGVGRRRMLVWLHVTALATFGLLVGVLYLARLL